MDDLFLNLGDTRRILHQVSADEAFTVTSGTITIYNEAGTATVTAAAISADPDFGDSAQEHDLYYAWTPGAAGLYRYTLRYVVGGETLSLRGRATVWPATSLLDRYLERIQDLVQEHETGEAQQMLGLRDYQNVLALAVREYSRHQPRRLASEIALTDDVWEYDLADLETGQSPAAAWVDGFSEITGLEPDTTLDPPRRYLDVLGWEVDRAAAQWRFTKRTPATGETARIHWTTPHTLSHTVDTLPAGAFELVCKWAVGEALTGPLANQAAHTNDPQVGADVVSYRDITQRRAAQGARHKQDAERAWKGLSLNL